MKWLAIACALGVVCIDIADRDDVSEASVPARIAASHTSKTDTTNPWTIIC